jgi:1,4-alpha-glucan branching enzyme
MPNRGCFYPAKTPNGIYILGRDYYSVQEIANISCDETYRNNDRDVGYELPLETVRQFLSAEGERRRTGFKYWSRLNTGSTNSQEETVYDPQVASDLAKRHARLFLEKTIGRLEEAAHYMEEAPLCLYAHNADRFGSLWHEGPQFMEALFRMASGYRDFQFITPSEYIYKQDYASMQVITPEFSSSGINGYAETWLDVSNDWIYRHLARAMERMTELAERFPDDTGLKERALNQAAREILLAQSSDWSSMLYKQDSTEYARYQAESALRNFTTIYEALGSNYISTEWLTTLERRHNIFPNINYRVFRRKK